MNYQAKKHSIIGAPNLLMITFLLICGRAFAQDANSASAFKQEQLEQILAPVALYPDEVLSQILMASTYPLEIVQAERWAKENSGLKGDELTKALEGKTWDPSVKSLVNFPEVLKMMSEKLDWTENLGDAFLEQQKQVMETVQKLRKKAKDQGNLNTNEQQIVKEEQQVIIIEPADPQVVYVPTYNPTVVYGAWPYPAYPPYSYYPPGYYAGRAFAFGTGVALGAAWGYAWGHSDWHGGDVDIDVDRNFNSNRNINRDKYRNSGNFGQNGKGTWNHNPANRRGVAYRDSATSQRFNRGANSSAIQSREAFRGRTAAGGQNLSRANATQRTGSAARPSGRTMGSTNRGGALSGMSSGGSSTRMSSSRGQTSRQSMSSRSSGRSGGATRSRGASRGGGRGRGGGGRR